MDCLALDVSAILEQGHTDSLAVVVDDDLSSSVVIRQHSIELSVLHHVLAECMDALPTSIVWVRCVVVASLLSESLSTDSDVLDSNGLGKQVNHVGFAKSMMVDRLEVELPPYLDES